MLFRSEALLYDYRCEHAAALLWVSHDPRQAARVARRRFLLEDGRLVDEAGAERASAGAGKGKATGADTAPGAEAAAW